MANGIWGLPRRGNHGSTSGGPQANQPVPTFQPLQSISGGMGRGMPITGGVQPYAQIGTQPIGGAANVPAHGSPPSNVPFAPRQVVSSPYQGSPPTNPPFAPRQVVNSPYQGSPPRNPPFAPPQDVNSPYQGHQLSVSPPRRPPTAMLTDLQPASGEQPLVQHQSQNQVIMTGDEFSRLCETQYPSWPWQAWAQGSEIHEVRLVNTREQPFDETDPNVRLYRYMNKLFFLMRAPPGSQATRQYIKSWLRTAVSARDAIGEWQRRDIMPVTRFVVHLEEAMFKIADAIPKQAGDPIVRPPGYKLWHMDNALERFMKEEVAATLRHTTDDPAETLLRCSSPQQVIDAMARNRVWPLDWFGEPSGNQQYTELVLPFRAAWVTAYWTLVAQGRMRFDNEVHGFVEDEAVYLKSYYVYTDFDDPLPDMHRWTAAANVASIMRRLDYDPPLKVVNHDYYSTLFIHSALDFSNTRKPWARGVPKERVRMHYDYVRRCTVDTILKHHTSRSAYTMEMATVLTSVVQNVLDWLMHDNDFEWFFDVNQVPRVIFEQLQVVVHGISLYRPQALLSRELILAGREPMPEGEVMHRILSHIKKNRREPAADQYQVDEAANESSSLRSSTRSSRSKRVPKVDVPAHELRGRYWEMDVYNLETFPSIEMVRAKGEVRIRDRRYLPADIILAWGKYACYACLIHSPKTGVNRVCPRWEHQRCVFCRKKMGTLQCTWANAKWGNISIKDYDVTGKRNKEIDEDWIQNILMEKWFDDTDDFPLPEGQNAQVPEAWPDAKTVYACLQDANGMKSVSCTPNFRDMHKRLSIKVLQDGLSNPRLLKPLIDQHRLPSYAPQTNFGSVSFDSSLRHLLLPKLQRYWHETAHHSVQQVGVGRGDALASRACQAWMGRALLRRREVFRLPAISQSLSAYDQRLAHKFLHLLLTLQQLDHQHRNHIDHQHTAMLTTASSVFCWANAPLGLAWKGLKFAWSGSSVGGVVGIARGAIELLEVTNLMLAAVEQIIDRLLVLKEKIAQLRAAKEEKKKEGEGAGVGDGQGQGAVGAEMTYTRERLDPVKARQAHAPQVSAPHTGYADAYEGLCHMLDSPKISLVLNVKLAYFDDQILCRPNTLPSKYFIAQILHRPNTSSPKYFIAQILCCPSTQSTKYSMRKRHADGQNKDSRHKPTRVGKKTKRGPDAATKLPAVNPTTCCRLKLLKMERIKDYLLLEEKSVQNQERLKPNVPQDRNSEIIHHESAIRPSVLHHKTSAVIGVLQDDTDPMVNLMKLDQAPTETIPQPARRFRHPRRRDGHHVDQHDGAKARALVGQADALARGDWRMAKGRALVGRADGLDLVKVQIAKAGMPLSD
ncbi:hypothetical protein CALVIDRAFT_584637 [Calocera viscosa TUFC12733]|uniref:Putative Zn2Cys6 domain-containing protein n=1 Tax=Calocera viscosa (strain TUFC12733) TaxID=1330018 RepID=A0A167IW41_CALVF|nr:hypothetical protein CALVIDRAFT_584637 [Calocera viscosa TUFC12733]